LEFVPYLEELMRGLKDKNQKSRSEPGDIRTKNISPVSHEQAEAASPYDTSVAGEEDPGVALEELVEDRKVDPIHPKR